jgi:hypothetical protein
VQWLLTPAAHLASIVRLHLIGTADKLACQPSHTWLLTIQRGRQILTTLFSSFLSISMLDRPSARAVGPVGTLCY